MKTFLFIAALCFNLLLCFYPSQEMAATSEILESKNDLQFHKAAPGPEAAGLAYSELLKNKAAQVLKQNKPSTR